VVTRAIGSQSAQIALHFRVVFPSGSDCLALLCCFPSESVCLPPICHNLVMAWCGDVWLWCGRHVMFMQCLGTIFTAMLACAGMTGCFGACAGHAVQGAPAPGSRRHHRGAVHVVAHVVRMLWLQYHMLRTHAATAAAYWMSDHQCTCSAGL
jgi:hypothetical protein